MLWLAASLYFRSVNIEPQWQRRSELWYGQNKQIESSPPFFVVVVVVIFLLFFGWTYCPLSWFWISGYLVPEGMWASGFFDSSYSAEHRSLMGCWLTPCLFFGLPGVALRGYQGGGPRGDAEHHPALHSGAQGWHWHCNLILFGVFWFFLLLLFGAGGKVVPEVWGKAVPAAGLVSQ